MRWTPILSLAMILGTPLAGAQPAATAAPAFADAYPAAGVGCPAPHPMGWRASFPGEGPMGPPPGHGVEPPLPPYLHGLTLSDEQEDRVFDLLHEQAPHARQLARAAHKSRDQLRALALSDKYDETAARALVDNTAKAEAELVLLRLHTDHAVLALLTPEQRQQVAAAQAAALHESAMHGFAMHEPFGGERPPLGATAAPCWH